MLERDVAIKKGSECGWWSEAWAPEPGCLSTKPPFPGCVPLGRLLSFSRPQFPCLQNGNKISHPAIVKLNELTFEKR